MVQKGKNLPAHERKRVIVETVISLAAEGKPSDITTAAIAERMNLTQGALFRHFPTKEAIWKAVLDWVGKSLFSRLDKAAADAGSPLEALEAIFLAHVQFASEHPGAPRLLLSEFQRTEESPVRSLVHSLLKKYDSRVVALLEEGKMTGDVDPALDSPFAAALFTGTIQGLVLQSQLEEDNRDGLLKAHRVFAIYRRGIERRDPA
ncbi:MAG TPA: TetR/AcrR family transcriptional regulator [Synergistales bacterium]|nr:TetR/AcrR family transcriptional regulator [Synergistales bacterium]